VSSTTAIVFFAAGAAAGAQADNSMPAITNITTEIKVTLRIAFFSLLE
jgi:hypothetical protein